MSMFSSSKGTVNAGFEELAKNIEPSILEYTSVNRCRESIQNYLGQHDCGHPSIDMIVDTHQSIDTSKSSS